MNDEWARAETSSHQDAVVSHILGATVLGYLIHDESLHLLLDIGFIWTIYLDGQMVLLPHPVATAELQVSELSRSEIRKDIDELLAATPGAETVHFRVPPANCVIREVEFFERGDEREFLLRGEIEDLRILSDLAHLRIVITTTEQ
jgi:hypothetical protein